MLGSGSPLMPWCGGAAARAVLAMVVEARNMMAGMFRSPAGCVWRARHRGDGQDVGQFIFGHVTWLGLPRLRQRPHLHVQAARAIAVPSYHSALVPCYCTRGVTPITKRHSRQHHGPALRPQPPAGALRKEPTALRGGAAYKARAQQARGPVRPRRSARRRRSWPSAPAF